MLPFEHTVAQTLREDHLLQEGRRILVGVSGGSDSMALLYSLAALRQPLGLSLVAVYVDHGLRPAEVPSEIMQVRTAARELDILCEVVRVDVPAMVEAEKNSLEHAARLLRYEAFHAQAGEHAMTTIAVAHTADDQAEEVLLRLIRGSGRRGLSGMEIKNKNIIRPLLRCRKEEILAYCAKRNIVSSQDSSNRDLRFLRNRVRHVLLPLLEREFDPGIREAIWKTADNLTQDEDLLEKLSAEAWENVIEKKDGNAAGEVCYCVDRVRMTALHPALQRRLAERLLWEIGSSAAYTHILAIVRAAGEGRTGSELHLSRGLRVGVTRDSLEFSYPEGRRAWRGKLGNGKREE